LVVTRGVGVEKLAHWREFRGGVIFLREYRAFFFYLRSAPRLILEILILGNEPVVSGSGL
jgi:hypothetical protein